MNNSTCDCYPFYSGSQCEKYIGCPSNLDSTVCNTVLKANFIKKNNISEENGDKGDSTDAGGNEGKIKNLF